MRDTQLRSWPCTEPADSTATDIDSIIEELKTTITKELEGRAQDKESAFVMERLRSIEYL